MPKPRVPNKTTVASPLPQIKLVDIGEVTIVKFFQERNIPVPVATRNVLRTCEIKTVGDLLRLANQGEGGLIRLYREHSPNGHANLGRVWKDVERIRRIIRNEPSRILLSGEEVEIKRW